MPPLVPTVHSTVLDAGVLTTKTSLPLLVHTLIGVSGQYTNRYKMMSCVSSVSGAGGA